MKQKEKTPYIVITKTTLMGLLEMCETKINNVVCLDLQFAGDEWPGQMNLTQETKDELWELEGYRKLNFKKHNLSCGHYQVEIDKMVEIAETKDEPEVENTTGRHTKKLIKSGDISGDKYKDGIDSMEDSMWYTRGKNCIEIESPSRTVCIIESSDGLTAEDAEIADIISCSSEMLQLLKKQKVEIENMIATAEGRGPRI